LTLSEKQKEFIKKNVKSLSAKQIAKRLNVTAKEVKSFKREIKLPVPKWFYIILFTLPILFFVLLEFGLRILNYGVDDSFWVDISPEMQILNPEIGKRYFFRTKNAPFSVESFVYKEKKDNGFRVFVLGASSGAGYPYLSTASFSKFLRKKLEILYPSNSIEVSNFSMAAINSYAIRDLLPDLLEKKPDLILIYLGHNEYYGALGIGSLESLGSSRFIVNTTLWLNKFKSVELLRNIINGISVLFSADEITTGGTLMAQMSKDKLIKYNSDVYWSGIEQFEGNFRDILSMCKNENVPVIASTLACNLKDQSPFVSSEDSGYPQAEEIFKDAQNNLSLGETDSAKSLFIYAKDLDALRFRAPEEINKIITQLCSDFNNPVIRSDSLLDSFSADGITGNDLMTDHLHPNVKGYQLIGNLFFSEMKKNNFLPANGPPDLDDMVADSLVKTYYNFTKLDSTTADFRIKILKNDWPYINPTNKLPRNKLIKLNTFIDSLAIDVVDGKISRTQVRLKIAEIYKLHYKYDEYAEEMAALVEEFPFLTKYYNSTAKELIIAGKYTNAYYFLRKGFNNKPDAFNSKWLGIIDLSQGFVDEAIINLEKSLSIDSTDAQTYFNITGAYAQKKEFEKALSSINKCLQLDPDFSRARIIKQQLESIISKKEVDD
jgi:tetratricopeptide (TPR) repeat protein